MSDIKFVKDYREKELRQYVLAYLLITVAFVGFNTVAELQQVLGSAANTIPLILQMVMTDIFLGAVCVLVLILNEIWSDRIKTRLIYKKMPSNTIFTRIATGEVDTSEFDLTQARAIYAHLATAPSEKQTAEWNLLLRKCREANHSNVIDAQRMQLMTRDIFLSTLSLLIMSIAVIASYAFLHNDLNAPIRMLGLPIIYLFVMLFVTRTSARNRANRFVEVVIKVDVQDSIAAHTRDDENDASVS